jgi:hypothetical protein
MHPLLIAFAMHPAHAISSAGLLSLRVLSLDQETDATSAFAGHWSFSVDG